MKKEKEQKASMGRLYGLHDGVATYFKEALDSGQELSSGTLAAINAFLKNNNITADVTESSPTQNLTLRIQDILEKEDTA
jgi:hypothetical protein